MIVLIAVAAIFALALQGAVMTRASVLEASVVHDRVQAEIGARGAAVLAIKGLLQADIAALDATGSDRSLLGNDHTDPAKPTDPSKRDLPPIIKALLGDKAQDVDKGVKDLDKGGLRALSDSSNLNARLQPDMGLRVLQAVGLPLQPVRVILDSRLYTLTLTDAAGGVSINAADESQLLRYFTAVGCPDQVARRIVAQIIDWRDADSVPGALGAEQDVYTQRGVVCRNAPFSALEELLYLPAMTRPIFDRCRDDLTLAPAGAIHAPSASRAVLLSVEGVTPQVADAILELRKGRSLTKERLEEAYPIVSAQDLKKKLRYEPSSLVRIMVEVSDAPTDGRVRPRERSEQSVTRFEGMAIIDDRGLKELGLRAVDRDPAPAPSEWQR